jgi:hypothetical protein
MARLATSFLTDRGTTASICTLDISKAFDKVDHYCLYTKLVHRGVPRVFISLLACWYDKCYVSVRWDNCLSLPFRVTAGVRQGGILSPYLFAVYIDTLIVRLKKAGYGLHVYHVFIGCIAYADDIFLIANSLTHMQIMLDICAEVINDLGLSFNINKSTAMRIGPRFNRTCVSLYIDAKPLRYVEATKYLGISVAAGRKWKADISVTRASFYRAFNSILFRSKAAKSELTTLYLLNTVCVPIITYALEANLHSTTDLVSLDGVIDNALRKIFDIRDRECVLYIRKMFGIVSFKHMFLIAKCKFLNLLFRRTNDLHTCMRMLAFKECSKDIIENGVDLNLTHEEQIQCLLQHRIERAFTWDVDLILSSCERYGCYFYCHCCM